MRFRGVISASAGLAALLTASIAAAQTSPDAGWAAGGLDDSLATLGLNGSAGAETWTVPVDAPGFGGAFNTPAFSGTDFDAAGALNAAAFATPQGLVTWETRETLRMDGDAVERVRMSVGGLAAPEAGAPAWLAAGRSSDRAYDVSYTRGWPSTFRLRDSDLDVEVTPHAGLGMTSIGGSAEAGAMVRIGGDLGGRFKGLVRDGAAFKDQGRWYLFAAGSGRAVGYNFISGDNGWNRQGLSTDKGAFIGDAQAGVAWRKGDVQASFGYVHREIKASGLAGEGFDRDKTQGLVAFQLSIKPEW